MTSPLQSFDFAHLCPPWGYKECIPLELGSLSFWSLNLMSLAIFFTLFWFKPRVFQNILSSLGLSGEHLYKHWPFSLNAIRVTTSSVGLRHLNISLTVNSRARDGWILIHFSDIGLTEEHKPKVWRAPDVPMLYPGGGPTKTNFCPDQPIHTKHSKHFK